MRKDVVPLQYFDGEVFARYYGMHWSSESASTRGFERQRMYTSPQPLKGSNRGPGTFRMTVFIGPFQARNGLVRIVFCIERTH